METVLKPPHAHAIAEVNDDPAALRARCEHLQELVVDLLRENQELRFQSAASAERTKQMERGVAASAPWAALVLP